MLSCTTENRNGLRVDERVCCVCSNLIEDETHVLLNCPFYDNFRENVFNVAKSWFYALNNEEIIMSLFSNVNMINICANTCFQF